MVIERPPGAMDLFKFIRVNGGSLPEAVARIIFKQIVHAVNQVHNCGVLHRDLKPANIIVQPRDLKIKLIDFGSSCQLGEKIYSYLQEHF